MRLGVPIVVDDAVRLETPSFVGGDLVVERLGPRTHGPPGPPSVPRHPDYTEDEVTSALLRMDHGDDVFRKVWPGRPLLQP